jgi:restriction system protein
MSLLLLFNQGQPQAPTSVPVLPADDPRTSKPLLWQSPLTERLIRLLREGNDWREINDRTFEEVIAELFDAFGYEVELTKRTRDGGRDVIAIRHSLIKDDKYLIECKHWKGKVGIGVVRELLGVGRAEPHSGLIVASTSGFTKDARVLAERQDVRWILALRDRDDLDRWVEEYARQRGWLP